MSSLADMSIADGADSHRREAREKARLAALAHSRRVRRLRAILPVAAIVVVGGMVAAVVLPSLLAPNLDIGAFGLSSEGLVVQKPRLTGRDGDRSYVITADRAVQSLQNPKIVELQGVVADVTLPAENWLRLTAKRGIYDSDAEKIRLVEGITVASRDGDDATLTEVEIDLKSGGASTDLPITVDGPRGQIRAGSAELVDDGNAVTFRNGVSLTIAPPKEKQE